MQNLRPDHEGVCVSSVSCCCGLLQSPLIDAAFVAVPCASELPACSIWGPQIGTMHAAEAMSSSSNLRYHDDSAQEIWCWSCLPVVTSPNPRVRPALLAGYRVLLAVHAAVSIRHLYAGNVLDRPSQPDAPFAECRVLGGSAALWRTQGTHGVNADLCHQQPRDNHVHGCPDHARAAGHKASPLQTCRK